MIVLRFAQVSPGLDISRLKPSSAYRALIGKLAVVFYHTQPAVLVVAMETWKGVDHFSPLEINSTNRTTVFVTGVGIVFFGHLQLTLTFSLFGHQAAAKSSFGLVDGIERSSIDRGDSCITE